MRTFKKSLNKIDIGKKLKEKLEYDSTCGDAFVKLSWKPIDEFFISKYLTKSETDRTVVLDKVSISVNGIIVGLADRIIIDKESLKKAKEETKEEAEFRYPKTLKELGKKF